MTSKMASDPTTGDIGFVAESSTIPELFIVSSVSHTMYTSWFGAEEDLPLATGEEITIEIDKSRE